MEAQVLNQFPLEVDFHQAPVHQQSLFNEQNAVVTAVVQSKHGLQCLKQNTVYKWQGSGNVASRPASGRQARSDGRLRASLSVEEAATRQQRPQIGVWCPVSGKPYARLGEIQQLEVKLPELYRDQAEAARAVKALAAHQQQSATEEQHAAARRHREERFSSVASSWVGTDQPRRDHQQQVSPANNDPDDDDGITRATPAGSTHQETAILPDKS
ncbi:TPA: hypothetical protein ACH3X1_013735 [Trebouxia sp. C0004]